MKIAMKICFLLLGVSAFSQESVADSLKIKLDVPSRYIWRGQAFGGNHVAVQPTVEYKIADNLTFGLWATSNFQKRDTVTDGRPKGYQEIDFSISYSIFDFLEIALTDYYWPSIEKAGSENDSYFNYGRNSVKTLDATLAFDFSELKEHAFPLEFMLSTFIAGNDFRIDNDQRNFTSYAEIAFTYENLFRNKILNKTKIKPTIGAVLNNQAGYYEYADLNKVSFVNLAIEVSQNWKIGDHFEIPVSISYIHNAAKENVTAGNNYVVAQVSLQYKKAMPVRHTNQTPSPR